MTALPGAAEAGERLKQTALRDFAPPAEDEDSGGTAYRFSLDWDEAPVPALLRYALVLIGLEAHGPDEKVAWWINFRFRGVRCQLAHQKFGLRLYVSDADTEDAARATYAAVVKKLRSAMSAVEKLILDAAPGLLSSGRATVINQHRSLRRAYEYFRERALHPFVVEDERTVIEPNGIFLQGVSFKSGSAQMRMNAVHDLVAAITAYLSLLEHELVLALAFTGFDPDEDDLTTVIGSRWGDKFDRLLGKDDAARQYRKRLTDVIERWRNPYSHGGFEKGHGATIYLHLPEAGSAVPIGLTKVRSSRVFSLLATSETEIAEVFALFDEIDSWLKSEIPEAVKWIESGLNVRYDHAFRSMFAAAREQDDFDGFLAYSEYQQAMIDNMDYP